MRLAILALGAAMAATLAGGAAAQQVITIASNPQGSIFFNASSAVAKVMDDKLKLPARVQPMAGSSTYIPLINTGEVEFGLTNVDDTQNAIKGTGNFPGKPNPNLRVVTIAFPLPLSILVPADSPIKRLEDLKGVRMPSGYNGQLTGRVVQDAYLATVNLSTEDMRQVPVVNLFTGVDAMAQGRVDASTSAPGIAQIQKAHADLSSRGGVRFLPLNTAPDAIARMQKVLPSRPYLIQPAPHFAGITEPTWVMAYSVYFTTHEKAPDQLVYNVAKMFHEQKSELDKITPAFKDFDPKRMTEKVEAPWHPGAIKFYQEIGQWPPKD
ncbi:MAG: TAXI family TRAP transporter solute-binding subunit [Alphaproteobacteria bacterium]|nr:TAXI family TRAP transporter solute-binding subunit [Alphaproteobacteria bacterium]